MPPHLAPLPGDPHLPGPFHLDAVLTPHRALTSRGLFWVMAIVTVASLAFAVLFWQRGAWPVAGFLGLDALLVWLALRASVRSGRVVERVRVTRDAVHVLRREADGRERHFGVNPLFARVEVGELAATGKAREVRLCGGPASVAIGSFLAHHEKTEFAHALSAALRAARQGGRPAGAP